MKLVAFCAVIGLAVAYVQTGSPPQWGPVYSVRGVLNILNTEQHQPFYARFDSKNGKSRIDYYGGLVKIYHLTGSAYPPFGTSIKIGPDATGMRKETCLHVNGTSDNLQEIQSVLPDMTNFKYIGTENIQASDTSKWQKIQTVDDKISENTMWVKYRKSLRGDYVAIPVRYEVKVFKSQLDSHYEHYYLDFSDYNVDEIHPDVFQVSTFQCGSFPEPDTHFPGAHFTTYNPMKEFVHLVHNLNQDMELTSYSTNEHPGSSLNELAESESGSRTSTSDSRCTVSGSGSCSGTCTVVGSGSCSGSCTVVGSGSCSGSCIVVGSGHCTDSCVVVGGGSCSGTCIVVGEQSCSGSGVVTA